MKTTAAPAGGTPYRNDLCRSHPTLERASTLSPQAQNRVRLEALADLIAGRTQETMIDASWLDFVFRRHGIGPQMLPEEFRRALSSDLLGIVDQQTAAIRQRRAAEALQLSVVDKNFTAAGIEWLILKGAPWSKQLYGEETARGSSDIDLLVKPAQFLAATAVLENIGWSFLQQSARRSKLRIRFVRDIGFRAPGRIPLKLELHQRPLFAEPFNRTGAFLLASAVRSPYPAPAFNPTLVWYCFAHGALCYWTRLKWLLDFSKALSLLDQQDQLELLAMAVRRHTTSSLVASLHLATDYFPTLVPKLLQEWMQKQAKHPAVQKRLHLYRSALSLTDPYFWAPFNNRWKVAEANLLFFESAPDRLHFLLNGTTSALAHIWAGAN